MIPNAIGKGLSLHLSGLAESLSRPLPKVLLDGVRSVEGIEGVSLELALDLRRFLPRKTRRMRPAVVFDPDDASESPSLEVLDVSDELEEPSMSAKTPG